jgi:hypothetical protein
MVLFQDFASEHSTLWSLAMFNPNFPHPDREVCPLGGNEA